MTIMERWESEKAALIQHYEEDIAELRRKIAEEEAELLRGQRERVARLLLKHGLSIKVIVEETGFTLAKIAQIKNDLKG